MKVLEQGTQPTMSAKDNVQHTNELIYLKGRIADLEKKLANIGTYKPPDNGEEKSDEDTELTELKKQNAELQSKVSELSHAVQLVHEKAQVADRERNSELSEKSMEYMSECERLRNDIKVGYLSSLDTCDKKIYISPQYDLYCYLWGKYLRQ